MGKYRKKPVEIDAVVFTRKSFNEIVSFTNGTAHTLRIERRPDGKCTCIIPTLEGEHIATEGDYIIRGVHGEFYPCKPDIFDMTYDMVDQPKTNADRIRDTDDELATMLHAVKLGFAPWCDYHCENEGDDGCDNCIKKWLQKPAEGEST